MKPARAKRAKRWKPPCQRPRVMAGLRAMVFASHEGRHSDATFIRMALPDEVQGVLSLCEYLGRFGDLHGRVRRTQPPTMVLH